MQPVACQRACHKSLIGRINLRYDSSMATRKPNPTDLSDAPWSLLEPLLPSAKAGGRPETYPKREILNGIFHIVRGGFIPNVYKPMPRLGEYITPRLINHSGRRSGLPCKTFLDVVKYDANTGTYFIVSGFGNQSDWYHNLRKTPTVSIQVGRRHMNLMAYPLTPGTSCEAMVNYAWRYPKAARLICRQVGYQVDGSEDDYRAVGREAIPFLALRQTTN